jgi:hypothetical protein
MAILVTSGDNPVGVAVIYDLLLCGLIIITIQICDFYLFYTRYLAVQRMSWCSRVCNHWFIWIFITMTWLPTYTFVPFITRTRTYSYGAIYVFLLALNLLLTIFYNVYYTVMFVRFLGKVHKWEESLNSQDQRYSPDLECSADSTMENLPDKLNFPVAEEEEGEQRLSRPWVRVTRIIAWKSIGHAFTSTTISVLFIFDILFGLTTSWAWPIVKMLGMHLWFNWRLEKVLCPGSNTEGSSQNRGLQQRAGLTATVPAQSSTITAAAVAVETVSQTA